MVVCNMVFMHGKKCIKEERKPFGTRIRNNFSGTVSSGQDTMTRVRPVRIQFRPKSSPFQSVYDRRADFQPYSTNRRTFRSARYNSICNNDAQHMYCCPCHPVNADELKGTVCSSRRRRTQCVVFTSFHRNQKLQRSAPQNTTQFLINDLASRYNKCSEDSISDEIEIGENNEKIDVLNGKLTNECNKDDRFSNSISDRMPCTFDKMFGLKEFESLYNDMTHQS